LFETTHIHQPIPSFASLPPKSELKKEIEHSKRINHISNKSLLLFRESFDTLFHLFHIFFLFFRKEKLYSFVAKVFCNTNFLIEKGFCFLFNSSLEEEEEKQTRIPPKTSHQINDALLQEFVLAPNKM
jgi:hypothetical protein